MRAQVLGLLSLSQWQVQDWNAEDGRWAREEYNVKQAEPCNVKLGMPRP